MVCLESLGARQSRPRQPGPTRRRPRVQAPLLLLAALASHPNRIYFSPLCPARANPPPPSKVSGAKRVQTAAGCGVAANREFVPLFAAPRGLSAARGQVKRGYLVRQ